MRQDQYLRLQEITEKLTDALLGEMDPDTWPGAGILPSGMDQQTRGDRYWCKKNAAATLTLIMKTNNLVDVVRRQTAGGGGASEVQDGAPTEGEDGPQGLDAEMAEAEREAARMLDRIQKGAKQRQ